jgi:hypothetical protein
VVLCSLGANRASAQTPASSTEPAPGTAPKAEEADGWPDVSKFLDE